MHRILFHIGPWPVYSYGFMLAMGILLGTALAWYLAKRDGGEYNEEVLDLIMYVAVAGIIGARLSYVILHWQYYSANLAEIPAVWHGGLTLQGSVIGALLAVIWYARRRKISFWKFADYLAPGVLLGQAVGRVGCFLNGCCYGIPTSSSLGVVFPPGSDAYAAYGAQPLLPAQLFAVGYNLLALGILLLVNRRKPFNGFNTLGYFALYSFGRFFLEFTRANNVFTVLNLTVAQIVCVFTFTVAVVLMIVLYQQNKQRQNLQGSGIKK